MSSALGYLVNRRAWCQPRYSPGNGHALRLHRVHPVNPQTLGLVCNKGITSAISGPRVRPVTA